MDNPIFEAAERLIRGSLVAFPTETVYGLGANASDADAIAGIYAAKGRPSNHPLIVHLAADANLGYWVRSVPPEAKSLIDAFWPGPLTLILQRRDTIPNEVSGGLKSIGLRCPSHPVAQELLQAFAKLTPDGIGGVAAPSANKFGRISPTSAEHVRAEFNDLPLDQQPLVLDGGDSHVGIESTILDLSRLDLGVGPVILRPGHISSDEIAAVLGVQPAEPDVNAPQVSGTLKAHYAPRTPLQLLTLDKLLNRIAMMAYELPVAVVAFEAPPQPMPAYIHWHVCHSQPKDYARDLYATIRSIDNDGYSLILLQKPPQTLDWLAVNDRLGRAAAAFFG